MLSELFTTALELQESILPFTSLCDTSGRLVLQAASWYTTERVAQQTCVISESANMASGHTAHSFVSGRPPCGKACNGDALQLGASEVLQDQGFLLFLYFSASSMLFDLWLLQQIQH